MAGKCGLQRLQLRKIAEKYYQDETLKPVHRTGFFMNHQNYNQFTPGKFAMSGELLIFIMKYSFSLYKS
jgi:hypothetical protein